MMKVVSGIEHISNHVDIIEAYIIDELNERIQSIEDKESAHLPSPRYEYEMEYENTHAEDSEERVIIIEL